MDVSSNLIRIISPGITNLFISIDGNPAKMIDFPYTGYDFITKSGDSLYITTQGEIYKSIDAGSSWRKLSKVGVER